MPLKCFTNTHQEVPETPLCVCFHGFMLQMKGRALVNIDERCHSTLLTEAQLEMRDVAFAHTQTHAHNLSHNLHRNQHSRFCQLKREERE